MKGRLIAIEALYAKKLDEAVNLMRELYAKKYSEMVDKITSDMNKETDAFLNEIGFFLFVQQVLLFYFIFMTITFAAVLFMR